jgi:hypothetical protein
MVEIYNIDISSHEQFARTQAEVEAFKSQYYTPSTGIRFFDVQTKILDFVPKHPAVELLMQTFVRSPWARFLLPPNYYNQRFFSSYVAPSLGSAQKQTADIQRITGYLNQRTENRYEQERDKRREKRQNQDQGQEDQRQESEEEKMSKEGDALIELLEDGVKKTNEMVDFISSRIHQFIQA